MKVFYNDVPLEELIESKVDSKIYSYLKCIQKVVKHIEYDDEGNGINVIDEGRNKPITVFMHPMSEEIRTLALQAIKENDCSKYLPNID